MGSIVGTALFLALPQLAGWIATRVTQRSSWVPWPAAAITVFSTLWYVLGWLPNSRAAASSASETRCGMWVVAAVSMLAVGLVLHTIAGVVLGMLTVRRRRARA
jgi:membrane protease YdiL (CAAX protease family)